MIANIHVLYETDLFRVVDFRCQCMHCSLTQPEYSNSFCVSFIRSGFFEYRVFRNHLEAHVGRILISKPGYEHVNRHIDEAPDMNTIFEFKKSFFDALVEQYTGSAGILLSNPDIQSLMLNSSAELEYRHQSVFRMVSSGNAVKLQVDQQVMELLERILQRVGVETEAVPVDASVKKYHLVTMESAAEYLVNHFREDVSLHSLAAHCCVSPFHFSRVFRQVMQVSPHKYLSGIRMAHANVLLRTTALPVIDIGYDCGYNSLEHFVTAYRRQFQRSPTSFRRQFA
jgi:AraC family transcriptional regulator